MTLWGVNFGSVTRPIAALKLARSTLALWPECTSTNSNWRARYQEGGNTVFRRFIAYIARKVRSDLQQPVLPVLVLFVFLVFAGAGGLVTFFKDGINHLLEGS